MTDILRSGLAPIVGGAWQENEQQSTRILEGNLSGRKLDYPHPSATRLLKDVDKQLN